MESLEDTPMASPKVLLVILMAFLQANNLLQEVNAQNVAKNVLLKNKDLAMVNPASWRILRASCQVVTKKKENTSEYRKVF